MCDSLTIYFNGTLHKYTPTYPLELVRVPRSVVRKSVVIESRGEFRPLYWRPETRLLAPGNRVRVTKGCKSWVGCLIEHSSDVVTIRLEQRCECILQIREYDTIQDCGELDPRYRCIEFVVAECPTVSYFFTELFWRPSYLITVDLATFRGCLKLSAEIYNNTDLVFGEIPITLSTRKIEISESGATRAVALASQMAAPSDSYVRTPDTALSFSIDCQTLCSHRTIPVTTFNFAYQKLALVLLSGSKEGFARLLYRFITPIPLPSGEAAVYTSCGTEIGEFLGDAVVPDRLEQEAVDLELGSHPGLRYLLAVEEVRSGEGNKSPRTIRKRFTIVFYSREEAVVLLREYVGNSQVLESSVEVLRRGEYLELIVQIPRGQSPFEFEVLLSDSSPYYPIS